MVFNMIGAPSGGYSGYQIDQSIVLDGSSDYLSRTPASQGDTRTFTVSCVVRRFETQPSGSDMIYTAGTGTSFIDLFWFANDRIRYAYYNGSTYAVFIETDAVFRDLSSWYHIVLALDTTAATASDRVKIWVNGILQSVDSNQYSGYGAQNTDVATNRTNPHNIAKYVNYGEYGNLAFADFRFIDGTAYDASEFGEFYEGSNKWRLIEPSGLTYGTNGFYLPFTQDTPNLGVDYSGNGNDWTENGSPVQSGDSPTVNVCTWNPLNNFYHTLANGNRTVTSGGNYSWRGLGGTIAVPATGKWYYECSLTNTGTLSAGAFGWIESHVAFDTDMSDSFANMAGLYVRNDSGSNNTQYFDFSGTGTNIENVEISDATYGIAIDFDNAKLWISKNNTWYSGDPSAGTGGYSITVDSGKLYAPFNIPVATGANPWTNVTAFAEDEWTYTPPTDFKAVTAANLPEVTITDPGEYFNVVAYTGDGTVIGSGGNSITGVGFQPDFTWIKNRDDTNKHQIYDILRGTQKVIHSNQTLAESTESEGLNSFDSDGFTVGSNGGENTNTDNYISWNWKANGTGVANTDGTISSTVSVNDDAGFSIATWASPLSATTIGHGLSAAPELILAREYDGVMSWRVYHKDVGNGHYLLLNDSGAKSATSDWNSTDPTSSVFSVSSRFNTAGNYLAYCFRSIPGYSKVFSFEGNGSADGPFVYLGFKPRWVMVKCSTQAGNSWIIWDTERSSENPANEYLFANASSAEGTTVRDIDIISGGFKVRSSSSIPNASSQTYIGIAFAENPFGGSNLPLGLAQ